MFANIVYLPVLFVGELSSIDTVWMLVCTAFVFLLQTGLCLIEVSRSSSFRAPAIAQKHIGTTGLSMLLYWSVGFGLMYGESAFGWIGTTSFGLSGGAGLTVFLLFQIACCSVVASLVSCAAGERLRLSGQLIVVAIASLVLYPLFGHWAWNGTIAHQANGSSGWLSSLGFIDVAGATAVHGVGGWFALAAIAVLGRRSQTSVPKESNDRFRRDVVAAAGAGIIFVGWIGLNTGRQFGVGSALPIAILNTLLAGSAGAISAAVFSLAARCRPSTSDMVSGLIGGLVAASAGCQFFDPAAAVVVGLIAGGLTVVAKKRLAESWLDDTAGVVAAHAVSGVWGTLAVAIFADVTHFTAVATRWEQLIVQAIGCLVAFIWGFGVGGLLLVIANKINALRNDESLAVARVHDLKSGPEVAQPSAREPALQSAVAETTPTESATNLDKSHVVAPIHVQAPLAEVSLADAIQEFDRVDAIDEVVTLVESDCDIDSGHVDQEGFDQECVEVDDRLGELRVLLADDNEVTQCYIRHVLESAECSLTVVDDGEAAFEQYVQACAADGAFDVVVIDCLIAPNDGVETTRQIREWERRSERPRTPIIGLLTSGLENIDHPCLAAGMDLLLTKPIDATALRSAILAASELPISIDSNLDSKSDEQTAAINADELLAVSDKQDIDVDNRDIEIEDNRDVEIGEELPTPTEVFDVGTHEADSHVPAVESSLDCHVEGSHDLLDLAELRTRCLNDDDFVTAVLLQFSNELPDECERIVSASIEGDAMRVAESAKAISGFAENVAATAICRAASSLEELARTSASATRLESEIDRLIESVEETLVYAETVLSQTEATTAP